MRWVPVVLAVSGCAAPTLGELEKDVFTPSCAFSTCHAGRNASGGLNLEAPVYGKLVNVVSATDGSKTLVVPGKPDQSWVMHRLTATGAQSMPPGDALDAERLAKVRAWIEAGAKND